MICAYKYRLYPTTEQAILIDKHIGASMFIYNLSLETKNIAYRSAGVSLSVFELMRDINAAINIKNYCLKNSGKGISGVPLEMLAIAKSMKKEVSTKSGTHYHFASITPQNKLHIYDETY